LLLLRENWPLVGFALLVGELVLGVGNLLTQYAWPFVGFSTVEVISSSITMVASWYSIILHKNFFKYISTLAIGINQHGIKLAIAMVFV